MWIDLGASLGKFEKESYQNLFVALCTPRHVVAIPLQDYDQIFWYIVERSTGSRSRGRARGTFPIDVVKFKLCFEKGAYRTFSVTKSTLFRVKKRN